MMDSDPGPLDALPTITRVALVISDINHGNEGYRDALLVALLRIAWPSHWAQDQ